MEIPKAVIEVAKGLKEAGFEAYLVGGCVRDFLLNKEPNDWDLTTNARPEQIQEVFPDSVYENSFGTVGVKTRSGESDTALVEATTYRLEGKYTDKRHPDEITFAKTIEEDLARRDFTINALAMDLNHKIVDPFGGQEDLKNKMIRAVGDPEARFQEDALRLMRAVRFMAKLNFQIDPETESAIKKHAGLLEFIAKERVRDELSKMLMATDAASGIRKMQESGLLKFVMPELEEGVGCGQNKHHIYDVFEHIVRALDYSARKNHPFEVRLAALLHDVGKPRSKEGDGPDSHFYAHQTIGEKMALKMLDRLHFSRDVIERVALLVKEHMFVYDPESVTPAGVRRLVRRVGPENMDNLLLLREADRIGSGVPKAQPYRLRHLKFLIEKVSKDPISVKMLKVGGQDILQEAGMEPGPKVGSILSILLEEVLDDPSLNDRGLLLIRIKDLAQMESKKLEEMAKFAKKSANEAQNRIDEEIKKKYFV
ncbi:MAG: HD domain-containing protein [bacterium]|nr:HD domain-containing protein [bacterium]